MEDTLFQFLIFAWVSTIVVQLVATLGGERAFAVTGAVLTTVLTLGIATAVSNAYGNGTEPVEEDVAGVMRLLFVVSVISVFITLWQAWMKASRNPKTRGRPP